MDNADKIKAPVLLLYGKQDNTVLFIQAEKFRDAMQTQSKAPFRFIEVEAQDHYFQSVDARQTVLKETGRWLETYFPNKVK